MCVFLTEGESLSGDDGVATFEVAGEGWANITGSIFRIGNGSLGIISFGEARIAPAVLGLCVM